jgi:hypothetical protein
MYALEIITGEAALNLSPDDSSSTTQTPNDNDVVTLVAKGEIPTTPQLVYNAFNVEKDADGNIVSCKHTRDIRAGKKESNVSNDDLCRLEPIYWNDPLKVQ